jgi:glycine cleavage system aminomethyltransferase T
VFELRGDRVQLDRFLIARLGDPPLATGSGRRLHDVWYLRLAARRTLLIGPHAALVSCSAAVGRGGACGDLRRRDVGETLAIVGIVGPRAARLLAAADLPGELPIGAVAGGAGDSSIVAVLRESQRRYLALVHAEQADAFWARLRAAGEPLGAAFVGYDALTLLDASSVATV